MWGSEARIRSGRLIENPMINILYVIKVACASNYECSHWSSRADDADAVVCYAASDFLIGEKQTPSQMIYNRLNLNFDK